ALTQPVRDALGNYDTIEIAPDRNVRFPVLHGTIAEVSGTLSGVLAPPPPVAPPTRPPGGAVGGAVGGAIGAASGGALASGGTMRADTGGATAAGASTVGADASAGIARPPAVSTAGVQQRVAAALWNGEVLRLVRTLG